MKFGKLSKYTLKTYAYLTNKENNLTEYKDFT